MASSKKASIVVIDNNNDDDVDVEIIGYGPSTRVQMTSPSKPSASKGQSIPHTSDLRNEKRHSMAPNRMPSSTIGMASTPIEIVDDEDSSRKSKIGSSRARSEARLSDLDRQYSLLSLRSHLHRQSLIDLEDEKTPSALARSLRRFPTDDDVLIEIDCFEQYDAPGLCEQDIYCEVGIPNSQQGSSKAVSIPLRNPTIVTPFRACEKYDYCSLVLKPNKTVELLDGDFLRIKDIIVNDQTNEVKLRGYRFQRVRDLNGMLEKKVNEVVLFYEIDLDDPRDSSEQAAIEVSLAHVVRMRSLRFTNQKFPLCRNIDLSDFGSKDKAAYDGGLTARWKYTCSYDTAADRHHNIYKERTLERIKSHEAMPKFAVSESTRRLEWRGETATGGAYRPTVDREMDDWQRHFRNESPISISSSPEPEYESAIRVCSPESLLFAPEDEPLDFTYLGTCPVQGAAKRKYSSEFGPHPKRVCPTNNDSVEEARRKFSVVSLRIERRHSKAASTIIDLSENPLKTHETSSFPRTIDPISSDLSSPPEIGEVRSKYPRPQVSVTRLVGQKYTYGDAFCGAGGATRGAVMAGLKVKWGFDFAKYPSDTWRQNFQNATCYHLEANAFIQVAKRAEAQGFPDVMKVDILHLSPPCQYFSPAHTVNGVDDDMNVASLFAVQSVIEVSKARVVTLEQTFGIACPRFRFYFNALIQMFTIHDFSVRWSVIPLAQWGLPQRRQRLIIIASCPGEVLPRIPLPTHSQEGTSGLRPFVSVAETLASIPPNAPDHDPSSLIFANNRQMRPWDDTKILPRAMTTSGGQNYHPSGTRDFTLREYAALQGFPSSHVFTGSAVKRQIGNAVPPCVARVLFLSIKKDLERADRIVDAPELIE